jgi:hypothetical protein
MLNHNRYTQYFEALLIGVCSDSSLEKNFRINICHSITERQTIHIVDCLHFFLWTEGKMEKNIFKGEYELPSRPRNSQYRNL